MWQQEAPGTFQFPIMVGGSLSLGLALQSFTVNGVLFNLKCWNEGTQWGTPIVAEVWWHENSVCKGFQCWQYCN